MPQERVCPKCQTPLAVPDDLADRPVRCGNCGTILSPQESGSPPPAAISPQPPPDAGRPAWEEPPRPSRGEWDRPDDYARYPRSRIRRMDPEEAARKVFGPAIMLMIVGVLSILWGLLGVFVMLMVALEEAQRHRRDQTGLIVAVVVGLIWLLSGFVPGILMIISGLRMKALRSYVFVLVCVIGVGVFGLLMCPLFILFLIWPFIVLMDNQVKEAFHQTAGA